MHYRKRHNDRKRELLRRLSTPKTRKNRHRATSEDKSGNSRRNGHKQGNAKNNSKLDCQASPGISETRTNSENIETTYARKIKQNRPNGGLATWNLHVVMGSINRSKISQHTSQKNRPTKTHHGKGDRSIRQNTQKKSSIQNETIRQGEMSPKMDIWPH